MNVTRTALSRPSSTGILTPEAPKVSDIHAWSFQSKLDVDAAHAKLDGKIPGVAFLVRDSEDEGRYVNGSHDNGTRFRILGEQGVDELEVYFPSAARGGPLSPEQRAKMVKELVPQILQLLDAKAVSALM
jgi:hypothetical protein